MKTICEALIDEIHYPINIGLVENVIIKRGLCVDDVYDVELANSDIYKGALADCLLSLIHSVNFSEADKSIGSLSDSDKKKVLNWANSLYKSIGEEEIQLTSKPRVIIGI